MADSDKHSSVLRRRINYGHKKFYSTGLGANPIKLFMAVIYEFLE